MATATDIIKRSLRLLQVIAEDEEPTGGQTDTTLEALNQMMARWETNGVSVGWVPVTVPGDTLQVPDDSLQAIAASLAVVASPEFGANPLPVVVAMADAGYKELLRDSMLISPSRLDHLPNSQGRYDITRDW